MADYNNQSDNEDSLLGQERQFDSPQKIEAPSIKARKKKHIKKNRKAQRSSGHKPSKRETMKNQLLIESSKSAEDIIDNMNKAYDEDLSLADKGKEVNRKIIYSRKLEQELRNVFVCEQFLELGGLVCFENWLKKLPNGCDPSMTIKKKLFSILLGLNVRQQHIAAAHELQRILQKNKRSPTKDMRDLSEAIISKWDRISYYDIPE